MDSLFLYPKIFSFLKYSFFNCVMNWIFYSSLFLLYLLTIPIYFWTNSIYFLDNSINWVFNSIYFVINCVYLWVDCWIVVCQVCWGCPLTLLSWASKCDSCTYSFVSACLWSIGFQLKGTHKGALGLGILFCNCSTASHHHEFSSTLLLSLF